MMFGRSLLIVLLVGCAPGVSVQNPSPFEEDDPRAREPRLLDEETIAKTTRQNVVRRQNGTIARKALVAVLDEGLGEFLRRGIEVKPHLTDRRFAGWRIVRFYPRDSRFAQVDLRPGDVVTAINQRPIERPKQAQMVWDSLRKAGVLVVRGWRNGETFELRYQVEDGPDEPREATRRDIVAP